MQKYKRIQDIFKAYIHNMLHIKIYIYYYITFYYYYNFPEIIYYHQTIIVCKIQTLNLTNYHFVKLSLTKTYIAYT